MKHVKSSKFGLEPELPATMRQHEVVLIVELSVCSKNVLIIKFSAIRTFYFISGVCLQ